MTAGPANTAPPNAASGIATFLANPSSANLATALTDETGSGKAVFADGPTLSKVALAAGTATAGTAPTYFTPSGAALLTSAVAGASECDSGGIHYYTHATGERGVVDVEQIISLTSTYTLANQQAAQKLFNSTSNGALTVASSKSYFFECYFELSSMSGSSGGFGFAFGGTASFTSQKWDTEGNKATLTTAASSQTTAGNTGANTAVVSATTATVGWARVRGIVRINAGGTLIPQVSLGVAAAAVVAVNSYFRIKPIGSNTVTNVGNWS